MGMRGLPPTPSIAKNGSFKKVCIMTNWSCAGEKEYVKNDCRSFMCIVPPFNSKTVTEG